MALKKNSETGKNTKKEGRVYATKWNSIEDVLASAVADEKTVRYTLAPDIELTVNEEKMWAQVNYCGCSFFTQIKEKSPEKGGGYFLSFPSYKKKDGTWEDIIAVYDKGFHTLTKQLLEKLAEE